MKRMLLTLWVAACAGMASAQWMKPVVQESSEMIVDEPMYLYNVGTKQFLTQGNAFGAQASVADEGLQIKIEKYLMQNITEAGDTLYVWDEKTYTIKDFRPLQNKWYYMFIDNQGGCYMDKGDQADYLWEITRLENGNYHISCAAANPTQNSDAFPNTCIGVERYGADDMSTVVNPLLEYQNPAFADAFFVDWIFVNEAVYADYLEKLHVYQAALKLKTIIDDLDSRGIDTQELLSVYNNIDAAIEELQNAQRMGETLISMDDEKHVTPDQPKDFTERIQNPDFNTDVKGGKGGWTKEGKAKTFETNGWVPSSVEDVMMAPALNLWGSNQDIRVSQVVENLPNGIYQFSVGVYSQANGPYIFAGDAKTDVTTGGPTAYSVLTYVSDHTLKIGVAFPAEGTQWVMADCCRLKYFGNSYEAYRMWIDETLNGGESFENEKCYTPLKEVYLESLAILKNATEQEQLAAELPKFTLLYDSIKVNIAAYADYLALWEEGRKMVREGAYAGEVFDILCDYIEMEDEPDELYPNGASGYILKHCMLNTEEIIAEKAFLNQLIQNVVDNGMAKGADATIKLQNPNFDNGMNGWSYNKKLGTPSAGGMTTNQNVERWNQNFDFYQEVSLPNGVYRLNAQAFYRTASNAEAEPEWHNGTAQVMTAIYANTNETLVKNIYDEAQEEGFYKEDNAYAMTDGKVVPNSMKTASEAFSAGLYENSVVGVVWNGQLRVGIRSLNASVTDRWSIWDNFRLTFLGLEAEPIAECYDKTVVEANELLGNEELPEEQKNAIDAALRVEIDKANASATLAAIAAIRGAMETANKVITGVAPQSATNAEYPSVIYTTSGTKVSVMKRGISIIRMSNGKIKKVLVQ